MINRLLLLWNELVILIREINFRISFLNAKLQPIMEACRLLFDM